MKLAIIKFSVGGLAVLISYIVSVVLPWKEFGGIFATFPAVFLVSMCITGMQFGNEVAMHVSRGAVFGMIGVLCRDRKSTRLNSSHIQKSRMPSSA